LGKLDEKRRPMNSTDPLSDSLLFSHEAMNTTFTLRLRGTDAETARGIARQAFELIDRLESRLSRFIESSDVSRINQMAAGEILYLSDDCHRCLLLALDAYARTGGLFDITLGKRIEHRKSGDAGPPPAITGSLIIHPDVPAVTCAEPGRELDLGGIGKGFALDQVRQLLADWEIHDALLAAGASSLLAIGPGEWPVDLTGGGPSLRVALSNCALSASGTGIQGTHIIHPGGDGDMPAMACTRIWTLAPTAALAEVWSTALMLVELDEIPSIMAGEPEILRTYAEIDGKIEAFAGQAR
jgi:thiamine biosynthesis lipoprotein